MQRRPNPHEEHDAKIRRMLLWFESCLPPHDLGTPRIVAQDRNRVVVQEDPDRHWIGMAEVGADLWSEVACRRCGHRWRAENDWCESTEWAMAHREEAEAKVMASLQRHVDASGVCWGDVPKIPDRPFVAVPDSVAPS